MDFEPRTLGRVRWSVRVREVASGREVFSLEPDTVLQTASVAKLLLLTEVAARIEAGSLDPDLVLDRSLTPRVADSGLWHLLRTERLPVADLALLVASVSDNWATNVLIEHCGLAPVAARARDLGLRETALLDLVRDHRSPEDPPTLSLGTAAEWTDVLDRAHHGRWGSAAVSSQLLEWMAASVDDSLVLSAYAGDPLVATNGTSNKTGSDDGVRADVGLVRGDPTIVYACLANWEPGAATAAEVVADMRALGEGLISGPQGAGQG